MSFFSSTAARWRATSGLASGTKNGCPATTPGGAATVMRRDRYLPGSSTGKCCPADAPDRDTCPPCTPFPVAPAPLLLREGGAFVPRYRCGWSAFYDVNPRRPDLTHMLPPYVAKQYSCVPGVGEVGWGEGVVTPASAMLSIST